jgi:hypothetical protein
MGKKSKETLEELDDAGLESAQADPGPLAAWKLSIAVAISAAFTGLPLYDAALSGVGVDMALLRSFGAAFGVWIAVGLVNRVLRDAQVAVEADRPAPPDVSPRPWVASADGADSDAA